MRIDIVADMTCPWCYLGKRRLDRALAQRPAIDATLVWRPFQLSPELPHDGLPRDLYMQIKFGLGRNAARSQATVTAAGREERISFAFDKIRRMPNTVNAHRLIAWAARGDGADEVVEALFYAYFVEARDIGDIEVLAAIAGDRGLGRAAARRYLNGDKGQSEVLAAEYRARRVGIHAVPCFVIDNFYALSGAQEPEMFLPLFDLASTLSAREAVEA